MAANASPAPCDGGGIYRAALRAYVSAAASQLKRRTFTTIMRPEIQTQLDNAKQSIGLLRRHL